MRAVFIAIDGSTHDVDVNIDANEHGVLLGGSVTFIGQIEHPLGPLVCMTSRNEGPERNAHVLPPPLQDVHVYGPIMVVRMDGGTEYDLTVSEYTTVFE